jgi:hypothetical protein
MMLARNPEILPPFPIPGEMAVVVTHVPRDRLPRGPLAVTSHAFVATPDAPPIEMLPLSIHHATLPPPWPLEKPLPWPALLAFGGVTLPI